MAAASDGEMIATGTHGIVLSGMDGTHWTVRTSPRPQALHGVVAASGAFLAVGDDGLVLGSTH